MRWTNIESNMIIGKMKKKRDMDIKRNLDLIRQANINLYGKDEAFIKIRDLSEYKFVFKRNENDFQDVYDFMSSNSIEYRQDDIMPMLTIKIIKLYILKIYTKSPDGAMFIKMRWNEDGTFFAL